LFLSSKLIIFHFTYDNENIRQRVHPSICLHFFLSAFTKSKTVINIARRIVDINKK
jgi:hypothetical protein